MKNWLKALICIVFMIYTYESIAQKSVLSEGNWIKIGITQSGIYKIDKDILSKAGWSLSQITPQNLKLYGNGGKMLPQKNSASRPIDLIENAILVRGEQDGKWDDTDYILFYGEAPQQLIIDKGQKQISHQINIYSDTTYYFLTVSSSNGQRIKTATDVKSTNTIRLFDDYQFHEIDKRNILAQAPFAGSGQEWYGEEFIANNQQVFSFVGQGIASNSQISLTSSVLNTSYGATAFNLTVNNQAVGTQNMEGITASTYDYKGKAAKNIFSINSGLVTSDVINVGLTFDRKALTSGGAFLNFLSIQLKRNIKLNNATSLRFRSFEQLQYKDFQWQISDTDNTLSVWNITNSAVPINQTLTQNSEGWTISGTQSDLQEYILFKESSAQQPVSSSKIDNQNLHGLKTPDLVIVCGVSIQSSAEALANFRRSHDKLDVVVATKESIYNEFSSGKQDITAIRDFVKYLYDQNPTKLKYLLLLGDASYDFKRRSQVIGDEVKNIYIPAYQSRESLHPILSYASDDYFGFMEAEEGDWEENANGNHTLDIGVGRLPVKTKAEANDIVTKLTSYHNSSKLGDWRSKVTFVADNGDGNLHQGDAEDFSQLVEKLYPSYQSQKIYLDNYPLLSLAEGQRSPQAKDALFQALQNGSLIVNYNGHGAETGWTEEQILTINDIDKLSNLKNLPVMLTATCQFGRYDDPNQVSGAELALLSNRGGAIALLTTTRPVYQSTNYLINEAFYQNVFPSNTQATQRLGDIVKNTKNASVVGVVNRNFSLLGDPSMQLLYPQQQITIDSMLVQGRGLSDTLKALEQVSIVGKVRANTGLIDTQFSGTVQIALFDKAQKVSTLGANNAPFVYLDYNNILFKGTATVNKGRFEITVVLPKDINYQYGEGKLSLYAQSSTGFTDAIGFERPIIGGSGKIQKVDNTGPKIHLYLDEKVEKETYITTPNPRLLVDLEDESGINIATDGLGHQILLTLDDTTQIILNQYYSSTLNNYQQGNIIYDFKGLTEGDHKLSIKVWDTYNNSSENSLRFKVVQDNISSLKNIKSFPNPFIDKVYFSFEHNREGDDVDITLQIFDSRGTLVKEISQQAYDISSPYDKIYWDLSEDSGMIVRDVYFYRIFVKSRTISYQASANGKLVSVK